VPDADPTAPVADQTAPVRWGFGDAAWGWLVAQIGGFVMTALVLQAAGLKPDEFDELSLGWIAIGQLGLWFGLLGAPVLATRLKGNGVVRDLKLQFERRDLWIGAVCGFVAQWAIILLYLPILWITDKDIEEFNEPARDLSDRATDPLGVILLVLIVGIGAPIVEEIFYRGLVQRSLVRRFGRWPGILLTAAMFGAAHFQPLQFVALAGFGLVVGLLVDRYDRLGPAIVAHMVFNLAAVVSLVSSA
jgi:membrane protease YdiL (CAAX protease family)